MGGVFPARRGRGDRLPTADAPFAILNLKIFFFDVTRALNVRQTSVTAHPARKTLLTPSSKFCCTLCVVVYLLGHFQILLRFQGIVGIGQCIGIDIDNKRNQIGNGDLPWL